LLINISRKKSGNAANARDNIMENDCLYIAAGLDYKQNEELHGVLPNAFGKHTKWMWLLALTAVLL